MFLPTSVVSVYYYALLKWFNPIINIIDFYTIDVK